MKEKRVVITGIGVVSPNGIGKEIFWENSYQCKSSIREISLFDTTNFKTKIASFVKDFDPESHGMLPDEVERMDRVNLFGMIALAEALNDAQMDDLLKDEDNNIGVILANAIAGTPFMEQDYEKVTNYSRRMVNSNLVNKYMYHNSLASALCSEFVYKYNFSGGTSVMCTGCAAGIDSIGAAMNMIKFSDKKVMVCGAAEAPICPISLGAFEVMGTLATCNENDPAKASKPYDINRNGFVLGEGSAIFVLEESEHAKQRGARIYAEVLGYGSTNNAYHMNALHEDGEHLAESMKIAINDAQIDKSEINYICAHGSATKQNDINETSAIKNVFADNSYNIPISSFKSHIGHALSAANCLEIAVSCLMVQNKTIIPTINYETPDPRCDLNYVPNEPIEDYDFNCILKDASGFGGIHSSVVLQNVS